MKEGGVILLGHIKDPVDNNDGKTSYIVVLEDTSEIIVKEKLLLSAKTSAEIPVARQSQQNVLESAQAAAAVDGKRVITSVPKSASSQSQLGSQEIDWEKCKAVIEANKNSLSNTHKLVTMHLPIF